MADETDLIDGFLEDAEAALSRNATAKAKTLYQGILRLNESHLEALSQLAAIAINEDDPHSALAYFGLAVEHHRQDADVHHGLSVAYRQLGHDDEAALSLETALRIDPDHEPALFDKARLLQKQGRLKQAEYLYLKLTSKNESRVDAIFNRGILLFKKGNLQAAERWFRQAVKLDPSAPWPLTNLALMYRYRGYFDAAQKCLEFVLEHHPDFADAQWNLANLELLLGDLKDGFERAEWRFKRSGFNPPHRDLNRWEGDDLSGKRLLLVAEQGLGDTIQVIRYAALLSEKNIGVGLEVQASLRALLSSVSGVDEVLVPGQDTSNYDAWLPIMSLPYVLGTTLESIPSTVPYVTASATNNPVPLPQSQFKVGIVWKGNPKHDSDRFRSIALQTWRPVLDITNVCFVSLQVGGGSAELGAIDTSVPVIDAAPHLTDFSVTATMIEDLDLIISVDTAVAHLAGAMGKPTWLLISQANDWRWMRDREDSPWYPSMRIFRSRTFTDWTVVMSEVAAALSECVSRQGNEVG